MTQQVRSAYRSHRRRTWAIALGLIAALAAVVIPIASGAPPKYYTLTPDQTVCAGAQNVELIFSLENLSKSQSLGSAEIEFPPAVTVTDVSLPSGAGTANLLAPNGVALSNLNLKGTLSITVTVDASVTAGSGDLITVVKQSNNFNDAAGDANIFLPKNPADPTSITVDRCINLNFTQQPSDVALLDADPTKSQAAISTVVTAVDATNAVVGGVSVSLSAIAGSTTPTGNGSLTTTAITAADGKATFSGLQVIGGSPTAAGSYRLRATSGSATATSSEFLVVAEVCDESEQSDGETTCSSTLSGVDVTATVEGNTKLLLRETGAFCGGHGNGLGELIVRPLSGKQSIELLIPKSVRQYKTNNGIPQINVCIGTNLPFTTKSGALATQSGGVYVGLLPNCPATTILDDVEVDSPCVELRQSVKGGARVVFTVPLVDIEDADGNPAYDPKWGVD